MSQVEENQNLPNVFLRAVRVWRNEGLSGIKQRIRQRLEKPRDEKERRQQQNYKKWVALYDTLTDDDRHLIKARLKRLKYHPLLSVVMPVYNTEERWLRLAIESVLRQLYPHWELCIADDCSTEPHVRRVLEEYGGRDQRIKLIFREANGHISASSNSALALASGEFVALLDHDDELTEHALYMVAEELNAFPEADLIYSDEDKINRQGERCTPHFKTDWCPDLFYSYNFISHLGVYRRSVLEEIGGFREGYEGSQDYDLALRVVERVPQENIRHIPHVLYHWRELPTSVGYDVKSKPYAHENARRALRAHFERAGRMAEVVPGYFIFHRVVYPLPDPAPLVSLVIATGDHPEMLRRALRGILEETDYEPLEVVVVDNRSSEPEALAHLAEVEKDSRVRFIRRDAPFNFAGIYNLGVRHARGAIVGLVHAGVNVISPDWLRELVSHAIRPEVGAVGAKLYNADGTIRHAGLVLGVGDCAGHAFKNLPGNSEGYVFRTKIIQNYSAVAGACLIARRAAFEEAGGLDEVNLSSAFYDVDFCLRLRALGLRVVWTPYAGLYYLESVSRGPDDTQEKLQRWSECRYLKAKWGAALLADPHYNPNLTLGAEDFSLAFPPRAPFPWKTEGRL